MNKDLVSVQHAGKDNVNAIGVRIVCPWEELLAYRCINTGVFIDLAVTVVVYSIAFLDSTRVNCRVVIITVIAYEIRAAGTDPAPGSRA